MKDSFVFYRSFAEALKGLPDSDQLAILRAIVEKALDDKDVELEGIQNNLFALIKPQLEANNKKYNDGLKGAEYGHLGGKYGKLGGRPKKPPTKPPINPPNDNENDNVNENENVNVNENENENVNVRRSERRVGLARAIPSDENKRPEGTYDNGNAAVICNNDNNDNKVFQIPSVIEIKSYCKERNNGVSASAFFDYYEANGWMVGKNRMADWRAAVRTWENNEKTQKDQRTSEKDAVLRAILDSG